MPACAGALDEGPRTGSNGPVAFGSTLEVPVSVSDGERFEQLLDDYREQFVELGRAQESLRAIACTVRAPRQVVSVTVAHGGLVTDVSFPSDRYKRLAPAELGRIIADAVQQAQQQAVGEAAQIMAPMMPAGFDAASALSGKTDVRTFLRSVEEFAAEPARDSERTLFGDMRGSE